jgi:hypothetical protein
MSRPWFPLLFAAVNNCPQLVVLENSSLAPTFKDRDDGTLFLATRSAAARHVHLNGSFGQALCSVGRQKRIELYVRMQ